MLRFYFSLGIAILPFAVLLFTMWRASKKRQETEKYPLTQRLLRPPGESLRLELESLNDKMMETTLGAMGSCAFIGFGVWVAFENPISGGATICIGLLAFVLLSISLWKTSAKYRDYRLGFMGERAVGEELNQLLASGWKVFHDVVFHDNPGQKPFNIDHIVVGTGGIFAIETKTRRKRNKQNADDPKNEVVFDGKALTYPWGEETFGVTNARKRANHLANWLKTQLKTEIPVQAVLALPGWSVNRRAGGNLRVISGKEVEWLFRDEHKKTVLDERTVNSVSSLIEQKCRDVE